MAPHPEQRISIRHTVNPEALEGCIPCLFIFVFVSLLFHFLHLAPKPVVLRMQVQVRTSTHAGCAMLRLGHFLLVHAMSNVMAWPSAEQRRSALQAIP